MTDSPNLIEEPATGIWKECYAQCFHDKRHYDVLSWSIGGAVLAYAAVVTARILVMPPSFDRVLFALSVIPPVFIWWQIYERNRAWGEICNEVSRDIERRFGVDGIQLRYMRAHADKEFIRTNSDLPTSLRTLPALVAGIENPKELPKRPMHFWLYVLAIFSVLVPIVAALIR